MADNVPNEETLKIHKLIDERPRLTGEDAKASQGKSQKKSKKRSFSKPGDRYDEEREFAKEIRELDSDEKIQRIKERLTDNFENLELWIEFAKELRLAERYEESIQAYNTVLIKDSKNKLALQGTGLAYQGLERWSDSVKFFERVLKNDPDDTWTLVECAYTILQLKDYDKGIEYYKKVLKLEERNLYALVNIGYCYYKKNELSDAVKFLSQVTKMENIEASTLEFARNNLASSYFDENQYEECLKVCDEMIKDKTDDQLIYYYKGWILADKGEYEEAIVYLKNGLKFGGGSATWQTLGFCYLELEKLDLAKMYYERCLEIDETNFSALDNLGDICNLQNNYEMAVEFLEKALAIKNDSVGTLEKKIVALQALEEHEKVINTIEKFEEINGEEVIDDYVFDLYCKTYRELNNYEKCIDIAERFIKKYPDDAEAKMWKATSLTNIKRGNEALEIFDEVIKIRRGTDSKFLYDAYRLKAVQLEEQGNFQEALECFENSSLSIEKIKENDRWREEKLAQGLMHRGRVLKEIGSESDYGSDAFRQKNTEAIKLLDLATEKDDKLLRAWTIKGHCYWNLENYVKSEECARNVLELDPYNLGGFVDIGDCLKKTGSISEANMFFAKALQIDNLFIPAIYGSGQCLFELKEYKDAIKIFEKVLAIDGEHDNASFQRARAVGGQENFEEAIELWKKHIEKFPKDNSIAYTNLSLMYILNKQYTEGITAAEESLKIDPTWDLAYYRIGDAYEELEEYEKAIEILEEHLIDFNDSTKRLSLGILIRCCEKLENKEKKEEYEKRLKELEDKN